MKRFTVTVQRAGRDDHGDQIAPTTHTVAGCYDWPTKSSESSTSFTQISSGRVLTAPHGSDLLANDTVVYPNGQRWHVVGDPYDWDNPHTTHRPGVQATLERVR